MIALLLLAGSGRLFAQQGGVGGGSLFGTGGGQPAFGQGGIGQSTFGQPAFGQGGFDQSGFGQGGQSAFGGGQNNTGFVGRDGRDTADFFQQLGRGSSQFLQRLERSFERGRNRGRGVQATQERRPPVRVQLSLGFDPPPANTRLTSESLGRISLSMAAKGYERVSVSINDGVAVLSGAVPTDDDRRLVARITGLEPGVRRVENRLTVLGEATEPLPPAPGT